MAGRRIVYCLALLGSLVFYWAYREWFSWFALLLLALLPWFSLLVSLPAILTCRAEVKCPATLAQGAEAELSWQGRGAFPLPRLSGRLVVENRLNSKAYRLRSGENVPTQHCGLLTVTLRRPRCHDYLGLFRLPVGKRDSAQVLVRPKPQAPAHVPDMSRYRINLWRPKPGGGSSENHELRLYRPGDSLRQVHWKLSAKTGQLITRESMEPVRSRLLLTLELRGTPAQLDAKLGTMLWMSLYLLDCQLPHQIQCLTGTGMRSLSVEAPEDAIRALDALLRSLPAAQGEPVYSPATWRYHIGGDGHG